MALVELLSTPLKRQSHDHHLCGGCEWKAQGVKSRKAHMVGVVVVKWLIVAHQHHPNTHHQVLPKNNTLVTLVLVSPSMGLPLKEGKGWL
jgi:hypothetical protein